MNEKNKVKRGGFKNINMKRRRRKREDIYKKNKVKRGGFNNINEEKKKKKGEEMYEKNKVKRGGFNNINVQVWIIKRPHTNINIERRVGRGKEGLRGIERAWEGLGELEGLESGWEVVERGLEVLRGVRGVECVERS